MVTKKKESAKEEVLITPIDKCNALLLHEHRQGEVLALENLKYTADAASNAAFRYLIGYRRLVDPLERYTASSKKVGIYVVIAFLAGAAACFYAFNI
jgi:hypothetical protein